MNSGLDANEYVSEFAIENIGAFINAKRNEKVVGRIEIINILKDGSGGNKHKEK